VVKDRDAFFSATICDAALTFVKKVLNEMGADRNRSLDLLIIVAEESCSMCFIYMQVFREGV